ncbi:MAG: TetR/AcrR family transcriptional regulator [Clostridia bacterium]|nr:TetR/AcrR family transcriptional regulator [Clostridia bacterium]
MKNGKDTRAEFLRVADTLFCQKGYDATSIQDILDLTHGSKGGFYHYFASKDELLYTICSMRADTARALADDALSRQSAPLSRVNTILHYANPLRREEIRFTTMLIPLLDRADGLAVRVVYQEALNRVFREILQNEIDAGYQDGTFFPCAPDLAYPVLTLGHACWLEASHQLMEAQRKTARCDYGTLQNILSRYRRSIEHLLDAPYGSVTLIELADWGALAESLGLPGF